ncbi:MAG TPA: hypothetical protein VFQ61_27190 [Polyangiaceae bacterium]|nr:hypothetical protein [Polyangiaceae bacterium]
MAIRSEWQPCSIALRLGHCPTANELDELAIEPLGVSEEQSVRCVLVDRESRGADADGGALAERQGR